MVVQTSKSLKVIDIGMVPNDNLYATSY